MSEFIVKSPQHCAKQGFNTNKLNKKLLYALFTFLISLIALIFLIYLILHPSKPEFYLKEADLYQLDLSGPSNNLLNSSLHITLVSNNPNQKVGVYYDRLRLHVSYKGQEITTQASLPPFYQGHQDSNILTALLSASGLPVASSFGYEVGHDQRENGGTIVLTLKADGGIKWKVGTWVSSRYHLNVDCVVVMAFPTNSLVLAQAPGGGGGGGGVGPLTSNKVAHCSTAV